MENSVYGIWIIVNDTVNELIFQAKTLLETVSEFRSLFLISDSAKEGI